MPELLIENGRLIDPSQSLDQVGRLWIRDGVFAGIDPSDDEPSGDCRRIDAAGKIVAPGLIDLGVELREPGYEEDETIQSGSDAALAGGYTSILGNANTNPVVDSPGAVEYIRQKAAKVNGVRVYVVACLSRRREGEQMAELGLLTEAGAVAFSDAPSAVPNDALLKRSLDYCRMLDRAIIDHPEVPELADRGVMHDGKTSLVLGLRGLPTEAEDLAVARDVRLAEATDGRLHVGPVSTMGAVDMIRRVKSRHIPVTASVCPHNLCLNDEKLRTFDSRFKVHPPLRSPRHVQTLCEAVADETIDVIQSGHMPRSREKKMNDLNLAPFGASALETTLSTVATFLVDKQLIDWPTAIKRLSTRPAEIASIPGGTLQSGQPADVVIFDPGAKWVVNASQFRSHCISSPMDGEELSAHVTHTIVGGEIKLEN